MGRRAVCTKQDIIESALDIIRSSSVDAITAGKLAAMLGISTGPIFNHFKNLEQIRTAALELATEIYDEYVTRGLSEQVAIRGFAKEFINFAKDEPGLFRALFTEKRENAVHYQDFLEGGRYKDRVIAEYQENLKCSQDMAKAINEAYTIFVFGIAFMVGTEKIIFTEEEIDKLLMKEMHALLLINGFTPQPDDFFLKK